VNIGLVTVDKYKTIATPKDTTDKMTTDKTEAKTKLSTPKEFVDYIKSAIIT
jgi:hypothetical protein